MSASRRALAIDWRVPTPQRDEGSARTIALLRALRSFGYAVTLATDFPESWEPHTATLAEDSAALRACDVEIAPGPALEYLRAAGAGCDLVLLCGGVQIVDTYLADVRRYAPGALVVYDTLDLHFLRHLRQAKATGNARALRRAIIYKQREFAAMRAVDRTLVVSPAELALLREEGDPPRVHLVTVANRVRAESPPFAGRRDLLFVGTYHFNANVDAMLHYLDAIHPLVRAALPGARIFVIGSEPPEELRARAAEDVVITGFVPDLAPWYDRCRLSIAPLRFGAGVKGKVLQSLGQGLPVVASPVAAEGLHLTDGEDVLIAEEPADFAAAIARLHEEEALWTRLAANGRAVIERHFSFETIRKQLAVALGEAAPASV
jgi:glycosyltransferase involved in cell wall biosynthesis